MRKLWIVFGMMTSLSFGKLQAQDLYWSPLQETEINYENWKVQPSVFKAFDLDVDALKSVFWSLGTNRDQAKIVTFPNPNGEMKQFYVWETPIMEKGLADKYPHIKTFTGSMVGEPFVTAKFSFTDFGFDGMVFADEGTYFIDPIDYFGQGYQYQIYFKRDYSPEGKTQHPCMVGDAQMPELFDGAEYIPPRSTEPAPGLLRVNGTQKRTYRLALSCTGEYAQAVTGSSSPTKSMVSSKMVTTLNRVNGVYERELSVKMVLIANNDNIVYTNPSTDPFTANFNGSALLGQNQSNTQSVIGNANYDIGHIFSTGGGGIAMLACVCYNSQKAKGVTGSYNPYGDAFDVDYVCHEMGHQFGANHTFNNCGGNENSSTAYEPGSGSTIMAYAGICGAANNLQNNSDDFFHPTSLNEIISYLSGDSGYGSASCAVTSPGSSTSIDIPSYTGNYYIPTKTAFEVEAPTATWSSSLRYEWESFNRGQLGRSENTGTTATSAPVFRTYKVISSDKKVRSFPRADSVHKNSYSYKGERTPEVARGINVRLTVRGMSSDGYGSFNTSSNEIKINYIATSGPFKVTGPNTSTVTWTTGTSQTITWDVAGTTGSPISTSKVNIYLSTDGGLNYNYTLATNVENTGSTTITVPAGTATSKARVKVKGAGNVFYDVSDYNFTIKEGTGTGITENDISADFELFPNPATDYLWIQTLKTGQYRIVVSNVLGQQVYTSDIKGNSQIDISTWSNGVYVLELDDVQHGGKAVFKIVKQ